MCYQSPGRLIIQIVGIDHHHVIMIIIGEMKSLSPGYNQGSWRARSHFVGRRRRQVEDRKPVNDYYYPQHGGDAKMILGGTNYLTDWVPMVTHGEVAGTQSQHLEHEITTGY